MKRSTIHSLLLLIGLTLAGTATSQAHCQIPCGIYGDETRFTILMEHAKTIRKSMTSIEKESGTEKPNYNQLVRWVSNKESHAQEIMTIVAEYFLAQRIKAGQEHYTEKLSLLHDIIVYSMKCKQTLDVKNVDALESKIKAFKALYLHHDH